MRRIPLLVVISLTLILPAIAYGSQRSGDADGEVALVGRMPEYGGWSQDALEAQAGKALSLRLSSADVMHGFAIGRTDFSPVDVEPGRWVSVTWTPPGPGEYTFYCTRWCGPNHWRMTGTIRVVDPSGSFPTPTAAAPPRYQQLGLDIDERPVREDLRGLQPSARRGEALGVSPTRGWISRPGLDLTTPEEAWRRLRADASTANLTDQQVWDLLASVWVRELDPRRIDEGARLYEELCAACHGSSGRGDGVMAAHFKDPPVADFGDLASMATANGVIITGKILRGGMGSGMPYWGTILNQAEIDSLEAYLWVLLFEAE